MMDKFFQFLEGFHKALRWFNKFCAVVIFLGTFIYSAATFGFPNGYLGGAIFGLIFSGLFYASMIIPMRDAEKARQSLMGLTTNPFTFQLSRQRSYATTGFLSISLIAGLLLVSLFLFPNHGGDTRWFFFFLFIVVGIIVERLFVDEAVKGKTALVALVCLVLGTLYLSGKIIGVW